MHKSDNVNQEEWDGADMDEQEIVKEKEYQTPCLLLTKEAHDQLFPHEIPEDEPFEHQVYTINSHGFVVKGFDTQVDHMYPSSSILNNIRHLDRDFHKLPDELKTILGKKLSRTFPDCFVFDEPHKQLFMTEYLLSGCYNFSENLSQMHHYVNSCMKKNQAATQWLSKSSLYGKAFVRYLMDPAVEDAIKGKTNLTELIDNHYFIELFRHSRLVKSEFRGRGLAYAARKWISEGEGLQEILRKQKGNEASYHLILALQDVLRVIKSDAQDSKDDQRKIDKFEKKLNQILERYNQGQSSIRNQMRDNISELAKDPDFSILK